MLWNRCFDLFLFVKKRKFCQAALVIASLMLKPQKYAYVCLAKRTGLLMDVANFKIFFFFCKE